MAARFRQRVSRFYPRSPCGERHVARYDPPKARPVSIHALLAESDIRNLSVGCSWGVSIHALLAESDDAWYIMRKCAELFLSTLSLRRATTKPSTPLRGSRSFYPRSPCGERHQSRV